MSAPIPTRQQIDAAEPLSFPDKPRQPRRDLAITITATVDGFPVEISFDGGIDQLPGIAKRLRELGAEPASTITPAVTTQAQPERKPAAKRVQPCYLDDGTEVCPDHPKTELREGKWGKYCPHKDRDTGDYCKNKFE